MTRIDHVSNVVMDAIGGDALMAVDVRIEWSKLSATGGVSIYMIHPAGKRPWVHEVVEFRTTDHDIAQTAQRLYKELLAKG